MAQIWDPVRQAYVTVDDGGPIVVPMAPTNPPVARIGSQPMPAPDDVTVDDLLTGNMSGAEAMRARAARAAAAAAPTDTGGTVIPSLTHGLPASPMAPLPDMAPPGAPPVAAAPIPVPAPAPAAPLPSAPVAHHAGGGARAPAAPFPGAIPGDQKDRSALGDAREDLLKDKTSLAARSADINADTAQSNSELETKYQGLDDQERARFSADFQKRVADRDAAIVAAANAKPHSWFSNQSTAGSIVTLLSLASGAVGAGQSAAGGHPTGNMALQQLNSQIAEDFDRQKFEIQNLKDVAAMKRAGVTDAVQAHRILEDDLKDKKAQAIASLIANQERQLKQLGRTQAEIDGNVALNDLRTQLLNDRRERSRQDAADTLNRLTVQSNLETAKSTRAKNYAEAGAAGITARAALVKAQGAGKGFPVRDPNTGEVMIFASTARNQAKLATDVAASAAYKANLQELLNHLQQHPERLLNPNSPEYQERQSLMGEVRVKGQQVMGGNSSDERSKLEGAIMGGSGAGFSPQVASATIKRLIGEADRVTNQKLNAAGATPGGQPLSVSGGAPDHNAALDWYRNPANQKDPNYASVGASLKAQGLI